MPFSVSPQPSLAALRKARLALTEGRMDCIASVDTENDVKVCKATKDVEEHLLELGWDDDVEEEADDAVACEEDHGCPAIDEGRGIGHAPAEAVLCAHDGGWMYAASDGLAR